MEIKSRRATLDVSLNGHSATDYVAPTLLDFTYTENAEGKADEVQLTLHDREGKWSGPWAPYKGSELVASFTVHDWDGPTVPSPSAFQKTRPAQETETVFPIQSSPYNVIPAQAGIQSSSHGLTLNCGSFLVDELELSGPPRKINIKAVSASLSTGLRESTKTQAWENATLDTLASDIAARNGLTLVSEATGIDFQRVDQREESDLAFLTRVCRAEGVSVRVHDGQLTLYNAAEADAQAPGLSVQHRATEGSPPHGQALVPTSYTLRVTSAGTAYTEAEVSYTDPSAGLTHEAQVMLNDVSSSTVDVVKDVGSNLLEQLPFDLTKIST